MTIRVARCSCGKLTATCSGEPVKVSLCHCLECQRRTGSTYGIAAFFERGNVEIAGDRTTYSRASDSGKDVDFSFCPACGGTVFWEPRRMPHLVAVAVGAFADPSFPEPVQSVYAQHRHHWVKV